MRQHGLDSLVPPAPALRPGGARFDSGSGLGQHVLGALFLLVLPACVGRGGPDLPENVGSTHASERRARARAAEAEPPAEPLPVGTAVWADFRDTGFHFHGVVVERRGEDEHRVVYDDGEVEWVDADRLRPDHLGEDAEIDVRASYESPFAAAHLGRRLSRAVYVRAASGGEHWTALPHVRFPADAVGAPRRGQAADPAGAATGTEVGASVLVDYQGQGLRFPAVITARGEDGRLHVVYLDGETEWVTAALVEPDTLGDGALVHVRRAWDPPDWVRGRVQQRIGDAFRVELDDGGVAWTSLFRVRVPIAGSSAGLPASPEPE